MEKTFYKVWTKGVIFNLLKTNVSHKILIWIKGFQNNMQALVKANGVRSQVESMTNSVPQVGMLSPTLFSLFYMNDMKDQLSRKEYPAINADDVALISTEEEVGTAKVRLQGRLMVFLDDR
ncbi:RNA-directed DNA polymerase from mobile element jockey [Plakobranchus ocellatus]|uniref:RNA-directed DNA polymerase from mobile element jockey n=1 Tax=Plakobranchus ocellatus TaxID=259542 RepID=A0AAV3YCK2_9GAST|nr:RNA-directed DNA polymerase from mobile element jockey [Plakobranchus ocellatus]